MGFSAQVFSQCAVCDTDDCQPGDVIAFSSCIETSFGGCTICDGTLIEGYNQVMFPPPPNGGTDPNGPNPLCSNGGAPHNMTWFAFVAGGSTFDVEILITACDTVEFPPGSGDSLSGMQWGIYTDCDFGTQIACDAACSENNISINETGLTPGETYYFFLDGCGGSVCEFTITSVVTDPVGPFDESGWGITGDDDFETCAGADDYTLEFPTGVEVNYTWCVDAISGPDDATFNQNSFPPDPQVEIYFESDQPSLSFPSEGTYQVCVFAENGCVCSNDFCQTITVTALEDEDFMQLDWCEDDLPITDFTGTQLETDDPNGDGSIGWGGSSVSDVGVNTNTVTNDEGCELEQMVEIIGLMAPPIITIDTAFCAEDFSIDIDLMGNTYTFSSGNGQMESVDIASNLGCDQDYIINVAEIDIDIDAEEGPCTDNGIEICLTIFPDQFDTETWYWIDETGATVPGSDNQMCIYVTESGTYDVVFTRVFDGVTCMSQLDVPVAITAEPPFLPPNFGSPATNCEGENTAVIYSLDDTNADMTTMITWSFGAGCEGTIVSGQGTAQLEVDWTGVDPTCTPLEICYLVENSCSVPDAPTCTPVEIISNPLPMIEIGDVCLDQETVITLTNVDPGYVSITWDWGTGTQVSGADPGPYGVEWTSGTNATGMVSIDYGCANPVTASFDVLIQVDPEIPTPTCNVNGTTLVVDWDDVTGVDTFIVNITSGETGTTEGSQFTVTDLNPGDIVTYTFTMQGTGLCADIPSMEFMCEIPDCPIVDLSLNSDLPDTICLDGSQSNGTFTGIENNGETGTGTYTSSTGGITDMNAGTFDPNSAGPGMHIIQFNYTYGGDGDDCNSFAADTVFIVEPPSFTLTADPLVVCVDSVVTIIAEGVDDGEPNPTIDVGNGTIISNPNDTTWLVIWNTDGSQSVTGSAAIAGCAQVDVPLNIDVQTLPDLNVQCIDNTTTSVTFGWDDSPLYDCYNIYENGALVTTTTTPSYTFGGLSPDTEVIIEVEGKSNNACSNRVEVEPCTANDCETVTQGIISPLTGNIICGTSPFNLIQFDYMYDATVLTGNELVTWSVQDEDGNPLTISQTGSFTPTSGGMFTIRVDLVDGNCPYFDEFTFTVEEVPNLGLSADATLICIDTDWNLEYTGDPIGDFNFTWIGMPTEGDPNALTQTIDFDNPGVYNLTLEANSSNNCVATPSDIMVEVVDSTRTPAILCEPGIDSIRIDWLVAQSDCNGEYTISVNGTVVDQTTDNFYIIYNLDEGEMVEITVENENDQCICPSKSSTIECMTESCPVETVAVNIPDTTLCLSDIGATLDLDALYDNTILVGMAENWMGTGITDPDLGIFDPNISGGGVFTINLALDNGTCQYAASVDITVEEVPNLSLMGPDTICIEDDWIIEYTGDDVGTYSVEWNADFEVIGQTTTDDLILDLNQPGTFEVFLDAFSEDCESSQTSIQVVVLDSVRTPQINCVSFTDSVVISVTLEDSECNGDIIISSAFPEFPQVISNGTITVPLDPGEQFDFTIEVESVCACISKSISSNCTADPCDDKNLEIQASQLIYCLDDNLTSVDLEALVDGSVQTTGLTWTGDNIDIDGTINIDDSFTAGIHTYDLEFLDGSCPYQATISIEFVLPPVLDFVLTQPLCPEDVAGVLSITNVEADVSYAIDGVAFDPNNLQNINPGSYTITAESGGGVCMVDEMITIDASQQAEFEIDGPEEVPFDDPANYSLDSDATIDSIIWTFNDTIVNDIDIDLVSPIPGELCAQIFFNSGCETTVCRELLVEAKKVFIPNVLNPDAGDKDGGFQIFSNQVVENVNYIKIYDRWGNLIFNVEDRLPDDTDLIWFGDYRGEKVEQGVYVYVIELLMIGEEIRTYVGDITVLR